MQLRDIYALIFAKYMAVVVDCRIHGSLQSLSSLNAIYSGVLMALKVLSPYLFKLGYVETMPLIWHFCSENAYHLWLVTEESAKCRVLVGRRYCLMGLSRVILLTARIIIVSFCHISWSILHACWLVFDWEVWFGFLCIWASTMSFSVEIVLCISPSVIWGRGHFLTHSLLFMRC